jgi:hypothetical protein
MKFVKPYSKLCRTRLPCPLFFPFSKFPSYEDMTSVNTTILGEPHRGQRDQQRCLIEKEA